MFPFIFSPTLALLDIRAGVGHLLIVVIPSKSGVRTALKIKKLAISFVGNLVADDDDRAFLAEALGEPLLACFPNSAAIRKTERADLPITGALGQVEEAAAEVIRRIMP